MRFFLVGRGLASGTVRMISETAFASRQDALDYLATIEPSELSGTDLFVVDLDAVTPVVVFNPFATPVAPPVAEPMADVWETTNASSLLEPVDDEPATPGTDEGLAAAMRRAATAMEADGVVAAPPVEPEPAMWAPPFEPEPALWDLAPEIEPESVAWEPAPAPASAPCGSPSRGESDLATWAAEPPAEPEPDVQPVSPAPDALAAELDALAMVASATMMPEPGSTEESASAAEPEGAEVAETVGLDEASVAGQERPVEPAAGWPWESTDAQAAVPPPEPLEGDLRTEEESEIAVAADDEMSGGVADFLYAPAPEPPVADLTIEPGGLADEDDFTPRPVILGDYPASTPAVAAEPAASAPDTDTAEDGAEEEAPATMGFAQEGALDTTASQASAEEPIDETVSWLGVPAEAEPVKGYEPQSIDMGSYTCDDCVYAVTCPKAGQESPSNCGSFQWKSI